jgi:hypothetical protein
MIDVHLFLSKLNLYKVKVILYLKVKLSFITIALNKSSFVKHITVLTAGNYRKSNACALCNTFPNN